MARQTILIIRHADKPEPGEDGGDAVGVPDQNSLTPRGWQRAANGRENASTSSFALIVSTLPLPGHFGSSCRRC